jgi:2-oxoglutarate dehydrogenase E2 component (dihydrolipoamide succinyltransferase)
MALIDIKIPSPGESISEVTIATWFVKTGDYVEKNREIAELESDKATLTLNAEQSGLITILAQEGDTVEVGSVACTIDTSAKAPEVSAEKTTEKVDNEIGAPKSEIKKESFDSKSEDYIKLTPVAKKILE